MPSLPERSDSPLPLGSQIDWLDEVLREHLAHISIVYLFDHGWQVSVSNPGGSTFVQACEGADKWPADGGPSLEGTILRAFDQAHAEGWW
jgi:hypothetical protein